MLGKYAIFIEGVKLNYFNNLWFFDSKIIFNFLYSSIFQLSGSSLTSKVKLTKHKEQQLTSLSETLIYITEFSLNSNLINKKHRILCLCSYFPDPKDTSRANH